MGQRGFPPTRPCRSRWRVLGRGKLLQVLAQRVAYVRLTDASGSFIESFESAGLREA
jgi:hypothetical protein